MKIPKSHPRYVSLKTRELIVDGVRKGITSLDGLVAHGRGEASDYLIGEKTNDFAERSIEAAAALLLTAKNPVISVNGNTAALSPKETAELAMIIPAAIEVNIFHGSKGREIKIKGHLIKHGAKEVLLPNKNCKIKYLESNRKYVNPGGIFKADVVLVPLEDGDRTEALTKNGKKVIAIDLNPMSRTAQKAAITIVDNMTRALPLLTNAIKKLKNHNNEKLRDVIHNYDNKKSLRDSLNYMLKNLP